MKHFVVWDTVSMAWSEIGLSDDDYPEIARKLQSTYGSWGEVNDIILGDVVGSFALESLLLPLAMIPLIGIFLISPYPDWGYEESYLHKRMNKWDELPRWKHYLNPFRLLGYPLAFLISLPIRYRLKSHYQRARA